MPKVNTSQNKPTNATTLLLDTSAQLRKVGNGNALYAALPKAYTAKQQRLQNRARSKAITCSVVFRLTPLQSPLNKSYWSTFYCSSTILQDGRKIRSEYCNQRWCLVCNRIRTAKLMHGYLPAIDKLKDPYLVTLTRTNVKASSLKATIELMQRDFVKCKALLGKRGYKLVGIRKVECTYNPEEDTYHPHFHLIIEGKENGQFLIEQWLLKNKGRASIIGQDARPLTDPIELFKYFTKLLTKDGQFIPEAMDRTFRAMKGKRVFQPFGGIKKQSEEVETEEATDCDWKDPQTEIWTFQSVGKFSDWYNANGEALSEVELTNETMELIKKIDA
jgi:hypothetical protein